MKSDCHENTKSFLRDCIAMNKLQMSFCNRTNNRFQVIIENVIYRFLMINSESGAVIARHFKSVIGYAEILSCYCSFSGLHHLYMNKNLLSNILT
jgi:hypothetical protein